MTEPELYTVDGTQVEAMQWTGENRIEMRRFLNGGWPGGTLALMGESILRIPTWGDDLLARTGDWVVRVQETREFYVVKPVLFRLTYKAVAHGSARTPT